MREIRVKTINLGRGEGEVVIRPSLHPYDIFSCAATCFVGSPYWQHIVIKINPFGIYEITWFSWQPIMQFWRMGGGCMGIIMNNLSMTSTIHVNYMKHDPIYFVYNFMLSKALLIHIYIVSIWCMSSFTIHLASNKCLYAEFSLGFWK